MRLMWNQNALLNITIGTICEIIPCVQISLVPQDHSHSSQKCQQASEDPYILSQASCKTTLDCKTTKDKNQNNIMTTQYKMKAN